MPKVTLENEHLQKNVASLTDQLETLEYQLEEERAARRELEDGRGSKIKDVENSWRAVLDEKQDNWEAKERSLEEKVESQERLLNELKASYEVSQRLGHNAETEGESRGPTASAAELEIINSDLDRTSQRLAEVEARNEQLRIELAEATSISQFKPTAEEDPTTTRLRSENSSLLRKLDSVKLGKDSEMRKLETRIRTLERDAQALQSDRESLRERLHSWKDYKDIKQELEIFKVCLPVTSHIPANARSLSNFLHSTTTTQLIRPVSKMEELRMEFPEAKRMVLWSSCYLQETRN